MARYIDADKLWNDRPQIPEGKSMDYSAGFSECMWGFSRNIRKQIDTESADVVPKSEVEELIKSVDDMLGLVCAMTGLELTYYGKYGKLKKKYTGEKYDDEVV